jgi:signal transduction histidine kinase
MPPTQKANAILGVAIALLLVSSLAACVALFRFRAGESWVRHTRDVQSTLAQFDMSASRTWRLSLEYLSSGDDTILRQEADLTRDMRSSIASVRHLTADNNQQQSNCALLEDATEKSISLVDREIELKRSGKLDGAAQRMFIAQVVAAAAEVDNLVQRMYVGEEQLLTERRKRVTDSFAWSIAILIISLLSAMLMFVVHNHLLTREVRARTQAEASQRSLSARLLIVQDEERRRFARELHDSVGQNLAALKMVLSGVRAQLPGNYTVEDCLKMLDDSLSETRTISHLLHPPLLDEIGLKSASRWFVEGFAKRSGIATKLDIADGAERLPDLMELVLFRVLQEGLTNVHHHSGAAKAEVSLAEVEGNVVLRIRDYGKGLPQDVLENMREGGQPHGVGLASMTERLREIGGRLEVNSAEDGAEIVARVPLDRRWLSQERVLENRVMENKETRG